MSWQRSSRRSCWSCCSRSTVPPLGRYMADVYGGRADGSAPGDRFFGPIERVDLPALRRRCQAGAALERVRGVAARLQPRFGAGRCTRCSACRESCRSTRPTVAGVTPMGSFNAAVSFVTNTNWQWYSGEVTMSHLTQMLG